MRRKRSVILVLSMIALVVWGVRVYYVNHGVARNYKIKTYQIGDTISFGDATFKVKKFFYGDNTKKEGGSKWIPVSVEMEVKNTSDKNISIKKVVEAKLAYGMDYYQTMEGNFDVNKLRKLPPNASTNISLKYDVNINHKGENAKLYIDQTLYEKIVREKYEQGIRYGISINLT
ncbi:uncharacterized protein DUF4352 [Scopulibacillus darangshiensis]|uniref:Uncharacterized protein DUF4352 n=1 Tax=Scopulibacillus darangshiensis TaxID=442528 RepID=A0A4R2P7I7_9BACL|nr:DUF4352 domain-containing protein [Scopulibacillus darangshiensis]TCP29951.1 uncharacterized protein DUF4352 [Scopulibacillus darangshiensis]